MSRINSRRQQGIVAVAAGTMAVGVYYLMINVTLAKLQDISGMLPFDLRPSGYSYDEAMTLLSALGEDGRTYYLRRQLPLDVIYPALLAITLMTSIQWLGWDLRYKKIVYVGLILSVLAAGADYLENLGIFLMIVQWPDVPRFLVQTVSYTSIAKAVLTTAAVFIAIGLLVNLTVIRFFKRRKHHLKLFDLSLRNHKGQRGPGRFPYGKLGRVTKIQR